MKYEKKTDQNKADMIKSIVVSENSINPFHNAKCRKRRLADTRTLTMKLIREYTKLAYEEIGQLWKSKSYRGKDHASVMHNVRKADNLIEIDDRFKYTYDCCTNKIKRNLDLHEYTEKTVYDELRECKILNQKLIHREISRKESLEEFKYGVRYIPKRYLRYIKNYLDTCQIHL